MRRYGGGILYAALPLHMQRGCFRIRTHDQQVTKAQLYRCTRARPRVNELTILENYRTQEIPPLLSVNGTRVFKCIQ